MNEIKPYQLAYSRATTIFQQQAALTSIEIIQRQYLGDGCKFKLDAYDEQVRAERINAIERAGKKDAASAAVEKKNRLEQEKKSAASAAVEKKKKREQEAKLEVYNTCIEGLRFDSQDTKETCSAEYQNEKITADLNSERMITIKRKIQEQKEKDAANEERLEIYHSCINLETVETCNNAYKNAQISDTNSEIWLTIQKRLRDKKEKVVASAKKREIYNSCIGHESVEKCNADYEASP